MPPLAAPFGGFSRVKVRVKINDITKAYVPPPIYPFLSEA